jgi:hypothetical protein
MTYGHLDENMKYFLIPNTNFIEIIKWKGPIGHTCVL